MTPKRPPLGATLVCAISAAASVNASVWAQQAEPVMPVDILRDDRRQGERREAVLTDDWLYCYPPDGRVFLVPKGYTTDFASIPRGAGMVEDQFGDQAEAAVVHDWLYAVGAPGQRPEADAIFMYAMIEQGLSSWRASIIHRSVRMFGNDAYGRDAEWQDNWTTFTPGAGYERSAPPIEKPTVSHVAVLNDCAHLDASVEEIKFRHGTQPDRCTELYDTFADLGLSGDRTEAYVSCLRRDGLDDYVLGIGAADQCTNQRNYACQDDHWTALKAVLAEE